jgi:hypothetical protein
MSGSSVIESSAPTDCATARSDRTPAQATMLEVIGKIIYLRQH